MSKLLELYRAWQEKRRIRKDYEAFMKEYPKPHAWFNIAYFVKVLDQGKNKFAQEWKEESKREQGE